MSSKNIYPTFDNEQHVANAPPQYGDVMAGTAPTMMPMEAISTPAHSNLQPAVVVAQQPPVYIVQNEIPPANHFGSVPAMVTCPSCHQRQISTVKYEASTKTHLLALAICLVGGCCCACIPYCVDSCRSAQHTCTNCGTYLGSYQN